MGFLAQPAVQRAGARAAVAPGGAGGQGLAALAGRRVGAVPVRPTEGSGRYPRAEATPRGLTPAGIYSGYRGVGSGRRLLGLRFVTGRNFLSTMLVLGI